MNELLIPFGLEKDTGEIVEPEDSLKGRACNCICPGCKAPLIARHSEKIRYHFAHDSHHELAKPEDECPFSSAVAVAMMIRRQAEQYIGRELRTPSFEINEGCQTCFRTITVKVAKETTVTIDAARASPTGYARRFDLELTIKGYPLLIDLVYQGKPGAYIDDADLQGDKAGVLALNCDTFNQADLRGNRNLRFSDAIINFFLRTGSRKWVSHPRKISERDKVMKEHVCSFSMFPHQSKAHKKSDLRFPVLRHDTGQEYERSVRELYCEKCNHAWQSSRSMYCPVCNHFKNVIIVK